MDAKTLLLGGLGGVLVLYLVTIARGGLERPTLSPGRDRVRHRIPRHAGHRIVRDHDGRLQAAQHGPVKLMPGTLNVGHTLSTIAQAFIYTRIVPVESTTLVSMIAAAMAGSWLGAGVVFRWPRRRFRSAWASRCSARGSCCF